LWREKLLKKKTKEQELTEKEFSKLTEAEKIAHFQKDFPEPPPTVGLPSTQILEPAPYKLDDKKYHCKFCGKGFDKKTELMNHRRKVLAKQRRDMLKRSQIIPIPKDIPKQYKNLKVEFVNMCTRVASTFFIPPNWTYIRVHKPVKTQEGLWVFFEPLEVKKI
jgi:hypothetical protein